MRRSFTPAWLAQDPRALAFLPRIELPRARPIHPDVVDELARQNPEGLASVDRLVRGAGAVVTGQQVGLFLGPLYSLTKALSAVVDAREATERGRDAVAVFWLQTEDADFEEVRHSAFPGGSVSLADNPAEARRSLAHRALGASVLDCLRGLDLGGHFAADVRDLLARHYRPERTLAEAFADTLRELTRGTGLLVLDPRREPLARLVRPVHERALDDPTLGGILAERAAALEAAGFEVQVPSRPGALLSCFHPEGPLGPRYRLVETEKGLECAGGPPVARSQIDPGSLSVSTTALLRPIVQDTLLPTMAVVLGPGELAYFAQLPPLYGAFGLPLPQVIPRGRVRLSVPASRRLAEQVGLPLQPRSALVEALARRGDNGALAALDALSDTVAAKLAAVASDAPDAACGAAAAKTADGVSQALARLRGRFVAGHAALQATDLERLDRWLSWVAPGDAPQERVLGFAPFAARVGAPALVQGMLGALVPGSHELVEVAL